jgi:hypothetical protein
MKEVSSEDKRICRSVDRVNVSRRYEESISCLQINSRTLIDEISEENVRLFTRQDPLLKELDVLLGRRDQPEDFFSVENVIPDRCSSKVYVEVSITSFNTHENVFSDFGIKHVSNDISCFSMALSQMFGPNPLNPVKVSNNSRRLNHCF